MLLWDGGNIITLFMFVAVLWLLHVGVCWTYFILVVVDPAPFTIWPSISSNVGYWYIFFNSFIITSAMEADWVVVIIKMVFVFFYSWCNCWNETVLLEMNRAVFENGAFFLLLWWFWIITIMLFLVFAFCTDNRKLLVVDMQKMVWISLRLMGL